ncbi:MAG: NADH:ubiquinone reductase ((+)-transporting) subunit [Bacteroidetes bacterium]|nr:NADH:ubiquinone reductase ((+)-transporting) subunit [Bacteroidota bacterium]
MFSNKYIFIYSTILVVVSAAILALAAVGLKPFQDKNIKVEKMQNLLGAVSIESTPKNAEELYNKYFTQELAINSKGEIVADYSSGKLNKGKVRPFDINLKAEIAKNKGLEDLTKSKAELPIYVCVIEGKKKYVIPIMGNGLWGGIWGNIAIAEDLNTVVGANFDHKSETPGLGAEVTTKEFQKQFTENKKTIFEGKDFVSVEVVKRADKTNSHQVDAISGGTITSNGVSDMIKNCLKFYTPYFNSNKK